MTLVVGILLVLLALASTIGAGLELDPSRVRFGRQLNLPVVSALFANTLLVPLAVYALLSLFPLAADVRTALWLVALSPGGASAPLLARLAGGEPTRIGVLYLSLSASSLLTLPLLLPQVAPAVTGSIRLLMLTLCLQLLPLTVGLLFRLRMPRVALALAARLRQLGSILLGLVVMALLVTRGSQLASVGLETLLAMLGLVLCSLLAGAILAPSPRLPDALLACVRNLTLALLIAETSARGGRMTLIIATYGLVMYILAAAVLRLSTRRPHVVPEML